MSQDSPTVRVGLLCTLQHTLLQSSLQERSNLLSGVALAKVLQETNITKLLNC
jgi:hypothetical protein